MNPWIEPLFRHPQHRARIAGWIYDEFWREKPGYSPAFFEGLLAQAEHEDRLPLSLVALVDGEPVGTVNLIENDDETRPQLRPWLAALIVRPAFRRRGVGSALVRELLRQADRLGEREVFLGTDNPGFYVRLGAVEHERARADLWILRLSTR